MCCCAGFSGSDLYNASLCLMAELKTYKVVALSVGGRGKRIFNSGDKVTENDFVPGVADQLVDRGYLVLLKDKVTGEVPELKSDEREVEYKREPEVESEEVEQPKKPKGKKKN